MNIIKLKNIISLLCLSVFFIFAIATGEEDDNKESANKEDSKEQGMNQDDSKVSEWLIGTWKTSEYADVEFQLKIGPTSNPSFHMVNQWFEADEPIEEYGNTLILTRNGVEMQFTIDKDNNIIYMGDGKTKLRKIGANY